MITLTLAGLSKLRRFADAHYQQPETFAVEHLATQAVANYERSAEFIAKHNTPNKTPSSFVVLNKYATRGKVDQLLSLEASDFTEVQPSNGRLQK
jgi:hypothetical protein